MEEKDVSSLAPSAQEKQATKPRIKMKMYRLTGYSSTVFEYAFIRSIPDEYNTAGA
jgi:hypothetical protein